MELESEAQTSGRVSTPRAPPRAGGLSELLAIALPMVVSQACETAMMFTDRLFLSRFGPAQMNAAMAGGLTAFMFSTFFVGLTGYANPLVAQYLGAGQKHRCATVVAQALLVAAAAYPIQLLCIPLGLRLFDFMGVPPEQAAPQATYFSIIMLGSVLGLVRNSLSAFWSGIGRTRVVMVATATSLVVNVAANYVLIFGKLGLPAMGVAGAAVGTIIGGAAGLALMLVLFFGRRLREELDIVRGLRPDWLVMRKLLRLGSPSGLEMFLNLLAFNLLVLMFHSYGLTEAAAATITLNWDMVSFVPLIGVNIGVMSLVGRHMGSGSPDQAHRTTLAGLKLAAGYAALTFTLFVLFPSPLVELFRPASSSAAFDQAVPLATFMVRLISVYVFGDAVSVVFSGALRGAGDTFATMCLSVAGHWVLAGVALLEIRVLGLSPRFTWTTIVLLVLGIALVFFLRYRAGRWRSISVVEPAL